jgi:hypothetical protein
VLIRGGEGRIDSAIDCCPLGIELKVPETEIDTGWLMLWLVLMGKEIESLPEKDIVRLFEGVASKADETLGEDSTVGLTGDGVLEKVEGATSEDDTEEMPFRELNGSSDSLVVAEATLVAELLEEAPANERAESLAAKVEECDPLVVKLVVGPKEANEDEVAKAGVSVLGFLWKVGELLDDTDAEGCSLNVEDSVLARLKVRLGVGEAVDDDVRG